MVSADTIINAARRVRSSPCLCAVMPDAPCALAHSDGRRCDFALRPQLAQLDRALLTTNTCVDRAARLARRRSPVSAGVVEASLQETTVRPMVM